MQDFPPQPPPRRGISAWWPALLALLGTVLVVGGLLYWVSSGSQSSAPLDGTPSASPSATAADSPASPSHTTSGATPGSTFTIPATSTP